MMLLLYLFISFPFSLVLINVFVMKIYFNFQMKWLVFFALAIVLVSLTLADGEIWEEDDHEVVIRSERGTKNREKSK